MRVTKCDVCKKQIKDKPITAGVGYLTQVEVCEQCGFPIMQFLKKHKFIKQEKSLKYKTI